MQKIDVTSGHILTKLFIEMDASESSFQHTNSVDTSSQSSGWQAGVRGKFSWRKKKNKGFIGHRVSGGQSKQSLSVKTVRSADLSSTRMHADMLGEVRIDFASNTFPAANLE